MFLDKTSALMKICTSVQQKQNKNLLHLIWVICCLSVKEEDNRT